MLIDNRGWVVRGAGILLAAAIASIAWIYIVHTQPPIYWLLVWCPYIFLVTAVLASLLLAFAVASPDPKPNFAMIILLGTIILSGWEFVIARGFIAPIHQASVANSDHVYHLAIDPLLDVGNPYMIFECDKLGSICREAYTGTYSHDPFRKSNTQLTLILDSSTLQVVNHDGEVVRTHAVP